MTDGKVFVVTEEVKWNRYVVNNDSPSCKIVAKGGGLTRETVVFLMRNRSKLCHV